MAKILFAWELGSDYGHLSRLLPVAMELRSRGHRPVFAVRDLLGAEALLTPHGMPAFQAPLWIGRVTNLPAAISYAEMLMAFGFLNSQALTGISRAWRNLVNVLQPDLLVMDHAPTALLGTRGLGLPRVNLADGFCIPPDERPVPPFRWWQRENVARLNDSEQHVLATLNAVMARLDGPPLSRLAELQACDDSLFCAFGELDHYGNAERGDFIGPIFSLGQGAAVRWPDVPGPRLFAYLKPGYDELDRVLVALHGMQASVLVHVPGAARQTAARHRAAHMAFSDAPLDMEAVRASCDLALCHGGAGTTAAMLLAGKPLMLFPMQMEQAMAARRLVAMGAAVSVAPQGTGQVGRLLKHMLNNPALAQAARDFAERHAGYDQRETVVRVADRCEAQLEKRA